jgi:uncharacterized membrane protein (UPF0127 family)
MEVPRTFIGRGLGLMFRRRLAPGEGLWLEPCRSVHMFFMRFPLDLLFIARDGTVLRAVEDLRPWRVSPAVWRARAVAELPAGTIAGLRIIAGDTLQLRPERST